MLSALLLSQGTPTLLAGDEFGRTQSGNNNAYCQDNEIGWLNWEHKEQAKTQIRFTQMLIVLRRQFPILRRSRLFTAEYNEELGVKDVTWVNANGSEMTPEDWQNPNVKCFGMLMDGRAQTTGIRRRGQDATLLMAINGYHDGVAFTLPECAGGSGWELLLDTDLPEQGETPSPLF